MIDTHAHLYLEHFDADRDDVIENAFRQGVEKIVLPNVDDSTFDAMINAGNAYPERVVLLNGLHPTSVKADYKPILTKLLDSFDEHRFYGVGETGIDLYWDTTFFEEQKNAFATQIDFSIQRSLPIVIHARNSFAEIFEVLKKFDSKKLRGVFHSFTGGKSEYEIINSFGDFMLGINGVVTYKNSALPLLIKETGLSRIVLETDAPYLPPVPYRGKRNESAYLINICSFVAEVSGNSFTFVDEITTRNAKTLFNL
jgi:TatD DNase family protein